MNPAGVLNIRAAFADGGVRIDAVVLERPLMTRLFVGQNPDAAVRLVPHLYALCGEAQRLTAQAALAAAEGRPVARSAFDDQLLWLELLHENLWRLLLDWPVACGLPAAREEFAAWRSSRLGVDAIGAFSKTVAGHRSGRNSMSRPGLTGGATGARHSRPPLHRLTSPPPGLPVLPMSVQPLPRLKPASPLRSLPPVATDSAWPRA
jgi:hypothetical protein